MAALPEALATAEAAMAYARQRLDEVRAYEDGRACGDLPAVIDAVDNNLRAVRRTVGAGSKVFPRSSAHGGRINPPTGYLATQRRMSVMTTSAPVPFRTVKPTAICKGVSS